MTARTGLVRSAYSVLVAAGLLDPTATFGANFSEWGEVSMSVKIAILLLLLATNIAVETWLKFHDASGRRRQSTGAG